jgi:hypothetical protein
VNSQAAWPEMEYLEVGQGGQGLDLPKTELFDPAAHSVQSAGPGAVFNAPTPQMVHEPPFGPE